MKEEQKEQIKESYITLFEAARLCSYSEPYLRLRARQGKLKSIKLGKKWMTTASWVADYEKRVREWKAAADLKKTVPMATLISAPAELSTNLEKESEIKQETNIRQEEMMVINGPFRQVWDFTKTDNDSPAAASRVPLARFAGGQILPLPQESRLKDERGNHFVWFGAFVSGVVSALILAFVLYPGGTEIGDLAKDNDNFMQANASQVVLEGDRTSEGTGIAIYCQTAIRDFKSQLSMDNLGKLVDRMGRFLDGFNISGW